MGNKNNGIRTSDIKTISANLFVYNHLYKILVHFWYNKGTAFVLQLYILKIGLLEVGETVLSTAIKGG